MSIVLSAQVNILSMAQQSSHTDRAVWIDTETDQLLIYLFNNRDKVGDTGNFKDVIYNGAAEAIAVYLQHGPQKTGAMCKMKWGSVSYTNISLSYMLIRYCIVKTDLECYSEILPAVWCPLG